MSEVLTWIEPNTTAHDLQDPTSFFWRPGAQGFFMPPVLYQAQGIPLQPGEIPRLILAGPRDLLVPVVVKGTSLSTFYDNLETMCQMFYAATTQAPGTLRYTTPNGHTRDLSCFYLDGAQGTLDTGNDGMAGMSLVFALHGADPFWYDKDPTILTFTPSGVQNFFDAPFFPLKLSVDGQADAFTIINSGDDQTWPEWTITGPGINPVLANTFTAPNGVTLTKTLTLSISLGSSDVLTIKTKPGSASIKKQDGSNQFSAMDFTSSLWPLVKGVNQCGVSISSPGSGTQIVLTYKQAYLAP